MSRLKRLAGEKIGTRKIIIDSYSVDENTIVVEGNLIDDRSIEYTLTSGEQRKPGIVHDMIIRLLIGGPDLTIKDLEVELPGVPRADCKETVNSLEPIKGLKITSGFTAKVKSLAGGSLGCAHQVALLLAMAPAVVQGFWVNGARKMTSLDSRGALENRKLVYQYLKNTCWVWREDGPWFKKLTKALE
jgi:hypothetical protein